MQLTRRTVLSSLLAASARAQDDRRDQYGGWPGLRFESTGYFRLERKGRWWLVAPNGNAWLSFGLNHAEPGLMMQQYNIEHWRKQTGADGTPGSFDSAFRKRVEEDLRLFGMNTLGCHTPARRYWNPSRIPYIEIFRPVEIDNWRIAKRPPDEAFLDVFSPSFEAHCTKRAEDARLGELANDPYLIGYTFTDVPVLTERDAAARQLTTHYAPRAAVSTWPRVLRNLAASKPGKQAYVNLIKQRYAGDIAAFNRAYGITFGSFDALANAEIWRPAEDPANLHEARDNAAFLTIILDRYYATMVKVIRRYDPRHLILGEKWNGNNGVPDSVIATAARYVDVIFYQWYGLYGEQAACMDEWSRISGKPLFNGDSAYPLPNEHMPAPLGPSSRTEEERAELVLDFGRRAFQRSDFIGWSYCGWMDVWQSVRGREMRQWAGVQDPFGRRSELLVRAMSTVSRLMYRVAQGG